jgi:hypothetical protein
MITWSLTTLSDADLATVSGYADDVPGARARAIRATKAAITRARSDVRPRYLIHVDANLVALIDTGLSPDGRPDHAATADLPEHLYSAPTPAIESGGIPLLDGRQTF